MSAAAVKPALIPGQPQTRLAAKIDPSYLALAHRLSQIRQANNEPAIFTFTAAQSGAGVTHVVRSLCPQLSLYTGKTVCSAGPDVLEPNGAPELWLNKFAQLKREHDYVLVECRALQESPDALLIGKASAGTVLVVEAGRTTRRDIQNAEAELSRHAIPLAGYVLNKRTDLIPPFIYRWLS